MKRRIKEFIPNVKDYYTIDDKGNVYSDNVGLMKQRHTQSGYCIINFMMENNSKKTYRVHRLVMMAFGGRPPKDKNEVNHIDGNKDNNELSNLEWCNSSENQKHAFQNGLNKPRKGIKSNFSKLTEEDIKEIRRLYEEGWKYKQIANKFNITSSNVSHIIRRKSWKHI